MMKQFIYVLCEKDSKIMLKHGFELAKHDEQSHLWVFHNKPRDENGAFPFDSISPTLNERFALSDVISL